eukprot:5070644-Lingulodinium_polyedra.AAC.1
MEARSSKLRVAALTLPTKSKVSTQGGGPPWTRKSLWAASARPTGSWPAKRRRRFGGRRSLPWISTLTLSEKPKAS